MPLVLTAFAGLVRLWQVRRGLLASGRMALSICADVGLLIELIWSLHIEYNQPIAFLLKAPTYAYIAVIIAIGVLRVDYRYGLTAGLSTAIVMLDIRGFTRLLTTLAPAEQFALLTSFHARIVPIIRAHDRVVGKFLGFGVMATFGAVMPLEAAAANALARAGGDHGGSERLDG